MTALHIKDTTTSLKEKSLSVAETSSWDPVDNFGKVISPGGLEFQLLSGL